MLPRPHPSGEAGYKTQYERTSGQYRAWFSVHSLSPNLRRVVLRTALRLVGIGLHALARGLRSPSVAQPPAGAPEVNPKVLAFLKPVETPARDGELQKKLKERHNVAAKLLEDRINEYRKGVRDINSVFEAA